jgi:hypothetical protein
MCYPRTLSTDPNSLPVTNDASSIPAIGNLQDKVSHQPALKNEPPNVQHLKRNNSASASHQLWLQPYIPAPS